MATQFKVMDGTLAIVKSVAKCLIYALRDPNTGEYRYIGQTARGAQNRACGHWRASTQSVNTWVELLKAGNTKFEICILEEIDTREKMDAREEWWIEWYRNGHTTGLLLNVSKGGAAAAAHAGGRVRASQIVRETAEQRAWRTRNSKGFTSAQMVAISAAMIPEQRRARVLLGWSKFDRKDRSARVCKTNNSMTAQQRSERARKGRASIPVERRCEIMRVASLASAAIKTPERTASRRERGLHMTACLSYVQLCERNKKVALAREANKRARALLRIRINLLPAEARP